MPIYFVRLRNHLIRFNMTDETREQIKMDAESAFQAKAEGNINYWNAQPEDPEVIFWKEIWSEGATHQHPIAYSQGLAEGRRQAVEEIEEVGINWVKRSERMPEPNVSVLVVFQYGSGNQEIRITYTTKRFPDIFDHFADERITHWALLPPMPTGITEGEIWEQHHKNIERLKTGKG